MAVSAEHPLREVTMRAMQVADFGAPLELVDAPVPQPGSGEVRISVHAAGVNFADMLLIQGLYQARPELPFAPGFEVAGVVSALGEGVATFEVGDRVMAFVPFGGYAEEVVAPVPTVFPIPDTVPFERAAVLPVAYGTAYHALHDRGALQPGETLVVLGASGGVGLTAVEVGKYLGATVIGCVGADWKGEVVADRGADHIVNYTTEDVRSRVRELTEGRGADVVYDPVGGDATDAAVRYLAWRGRLLLIGFTAGRIPDLPANRFLLSESSAVGVFWGRFAEMEPEQNQRNFAWLLDRMADETFAPLIHRRFPLDGAGAALALLAERQAVGKLVIEVR